MVTSWLPRACPAATGRQHDITWGSLTGEWPAQAGCRIKKLHTVLLSVAKCCTRWLARGGGGDRWASQGGVSGDSKENARNLANGILTLSEPCGTIMVASGARAPMQAATPLVLHLNN